eukprot:3691497-Alexandrium_andersonii.AAC.1
MADVPPYRQLVAAGQAQIGARSMLGSLLAKLDAQQLLFCLCVAMRHGAWQRGPKGRALKHKEGKRRR